MVVLLFVCLMASPGTCREDHIDLSFEASSDKACLIQAQPVIAEWQARHSEWHVERWRCASRQSLGKDI